MEYNADPNKKTPIIIVLLLLILGLAFAFAPALFQDLPSWYFQLPAVISLLICILFLSRYVLTSYTYQLYDAGNTMSPYPKLNVYRIRKAGSRMVYCIPFNNVVSIEKRTKVEKLDIKSENLCASMFPENVYCVVFVVDQKEAIFIECDERFAALIRERIDLYSEVMEN